MLFAFKRAFGLVEGNWFEEVTNLRTHLLQKENNFFTQSVNVFFPLAPKKVPNTSLGEKQKCKQH